MAYWSAAIRADGLIYGPDFSPAPPDETLTIQNAQRALGGESWAAYLLTEQQAQIILNALPGRSWWLDGQVLPRQAPSFLLDKITLDIASEIDKITAQLDVRATDTDTSKIILIYPSGERLEAAVPMIQGQVTFDLLTDQEGLHRVEVDNEFCGVARAEFTGVIL
jgi:hypothetical protein